jgi:hypothetical protein
VAQPGTTRPRQAGYLKLRDLSRRGCRRWSGRGGLVLRPTEQPRGKIPSIGAEPTRIGPREPAPPNRERRVPSPLLEWSRRSGRRRARWIRNMGLVRVNGRGGATDLLEVHFAKGHLRRGAVGHGCEGAGPAVTSRCQPGCNHFPSRRTNISVRRPRRVRSAPPDWNTTSKRGCS